MKSPEDVAEAFALVTMIINNNEAMEYLSKPQQAQMVTIVGVLAWALGIPSQFDSLLNEIKLGCNDLREHIKRSQRYEDN